MTPETTDNAVPAEKAVRDSLRKQVDNYKTCTDLIPPLQESEVLAHADRIIESHPGAAPYRNLLAVMINNAAWGEVIAAIPYEKRILLLPKCFRNLEHCPAEVDELGVLCERCGKCELGEMVTEAESLGYQVVISEGTTTVAMLMASGQVEAVIGVACLDSFEKSFPLVSNQAVPAQAVPLLRSGCIHSVVDREWLSDVLRLRSDKVWYGQLRIDDIRETVERWFQPEAIRDALSPGQDPSLRFACDWLSRGGKYWRPLIMTCLYRALSGNEIDNPHVQRLAIAVECFHKASLIHDDIEDEDLERYGQPTLHREVGTAVALNIGDLLIGLGYKLLTGSDAATTARMLDVAASGHLHLCQGQGRELVWRPEGGLLTVEETLRIYSQKTAPAFDVALKIGAALAGARAEIDTPLTRFSEALGIAYQIKDDLEDMEAGDDLAHLRPSILVALAGAKDPAGMKAILQQVLKHQPAAHDDVVSAVAACRPDAEAMLETYRQQALSALSEIHSASGKSLLQRLLNRILGTAQPEPEPAHKR